MKSNIQDRVFYHIYPLGMCGAPARNDFVSPPGRGLRSLIDRIPHLQSLGVTAAYIGPLFESSGHGYDTVDYYHLDRRLGTDEDLIALSQALHAAGIAVVFDAVLNHTGRDFFAFKDLLLNRERSPYRDWYRGVDFNSDTPAHDGFAYEGWSGNYDLAKLNTVNPAVREHLFGAVRTWIERFGADGLRLDAADVLDPAFMDELAEFCASLKSDFWLMGEVVHGDYRNWVSPSAKQASRLNSVTNYEVYKGLWSSFNDHNLFEIAWSLNRQYGSEGMYKSIALYNFVDNHDVNRLASVLKDPANLPLVYALLFTIPGIPSIYYGSEWGTRGIKRDGSDAELRPCIRETAEHSRYSGLSENCRPVINSLALENAIRNLTHARGDHVALREGAYRQALVSSECFGFVRQTATAQALVLVNAATSPFSAQLTGFGAGKKRISSLAGGTGRGQGPQFDGTIARGTERWEFEGDRLSLTVPPGAWRIYDITAE